MENFEIEDEQPQHHAVRLPASASIAHIVLRITSLATSVASIALLAHIAKTYNIKVILPFVAVSIELQLLVLATVR
jgi:hypothetical protein